MSAISVCGGSIILPLSAHHSLFAKANNFTPKKKRRVPKYNYDGVNSVKLHAPVTAPGEDKKVSILDIMFSKTQIIALNNAMTDKTAISQYANDFYNMLTTGHFQPGTNPVPFFDASWGVDKVFVGPNAKQPAVFFADIKTLVNKQMSDFMKLINLAANSLTDDKLNSNILMLRIPFYTVTGGIDWNLKTWAYIDDRVVYFTGPKMWPSPLYPVGESATETLGSFEQHPEGSQGFIKQYLPQAGAGVRFNFNRALCHIAVDNFAYNFGSFYKWLGGGSYKSDWDKAFGYGLEDWLNDSQGHGGQAKSKSFNHLGTYINTFTKQVDFYAALQKQYPTLIATLRKYENQQGVTMLATTTIKGRMRITFTTQGTGGLE